MQKDGRNPALAIDAIEPGLIDAKQARILSARAGELAETFATRLSKLNEVHENGIAEFRAERERGLPSGEYVSGDERTLARKLMDKEVDRRRGEVRRQLVESTSAERAERLRELMQLEATAQTLEKLFESPQQVLGRAGLGSPERDAYVNQLRGAGPTELASAARFAIATGDRAMAAAVMQLGGNVPKGERLFSAGELAEVMVGAETEGARERLAAVRSAAQGAINENRAFERGERISGTSRIAAGLRKLAAGEGE